MLKRYPRRLLYRVIGSMKSCIHWEPGCSTCPPGRAVYTYHHVVILGGVNALVIKQVLQVLLEKVNHALQGRVC